MRKTITDNSMEKIEVSTDRNRFSLIKSIKGPLPGGFADTRVTILNRMESIRVYEELGQWIRGGIRG